MAWRSKSREKFAQTVRIIQAQPGIQAARLAEQLGLAPSTVMRRLPGMEEAGYLLYEDEKGGLYLYSSDRK